MIATIQHGRVVHVPDPKSAMPKVPAGPVMMPGLRVAEDGCGVIRLVDGAASWGVCASREVAERTRNFFGGTSCE